MVTINLRLIGDIILVLVGIIAIVFLAMFLKKASGLVQSIQKIVDKNEDNLDNVINKLPNLVDQANILVENVNGLVSDPNLKMAISNANLAISNVSDITVDIKDTVNYFGESVIDTTDTFGEGIASINDYASLIMDVFDIVRSVISGRYAII